MILKIIADCKKRLVKEQDFEAAASMRNLENLLTGTRLPSEQKMIVKAFLNLL